MIRIFKNMSLAGYAAILLGVTGNVRADMAKEVVWPADKISFMEVMPGISKAVLWQTPTGAYAALTRLAPNTQNPLHTHTHTIKMVIISGSWNYGTESGVMKLGPGSYLVVPGGRKHTSGSGPEGVLFFEESDGAFDLIPVKKAL